MKIDAWRLFVVGPVCAFLGVFVACMCSAARCGECAAKHDLPGVGQ